MKQALLDTSFILTCVKQKIDFLEDLTNKGYKIIVPKQVMKEIEGLSKTNSNAVVALKILKSNKEAYESVNLVGKNTDKAIINYSKRNKETAVATLDREIKKSIKTSKIVIRGKKKLEVV